MIDNTIGFLLVVSTIQLISTSIFFFCFYIVGNKVAYEFKWRYLRSLLLQDKQWYDSVQVEKLPTEFHYNIESIEDAAGKAWAISIYGLGSLASGLVVLFAYGYMFGVFNLPLILFSIAVFFYQISIINKAEKREREEFEMSGNEAEQAINAIKVVKAYGQESSEMARFESHLTSGIISSTLLGIFS